MPDSCNPRTVAYQAPLSMGFPMEILEWVAFPSPGDLPDPGTEAWSPALQAASCIAADSLLTEPPGKPFYSYTI